MNRPRIALQLYTMRSRAQTPADFLKMLERVRGIGYTAVEFAGLPDIPIQDLVAFVKNLGLAICSSHEGLAALTTGLDGVIERARRLGTPHVVCPFPSDVDLSDIDQVDRMIKCLDEAGAALRGEGIRLGYHNHALEFHRLGSTTVLERIFAQSKAENLAAELDIHWVQAGGGNPLTWCKRLSGRLPILHVKDFAVSAKGEREFAEVGAGNLEMPPILRAAAEAGCEWFVVEQDACARDPFDCVADSLRYLVAHDNWTADCE